MNNTVTEYILNIKFTKDILKPEQYFYLGKMISKMIFYDKSEIKQEHYQHHFKPYVFSGLLKEEKNKIYKKNKFYPFILRTMDKKINENILSEYKDKFGEIKITDKKEINLDKIKEISFLITENPVILVKKNKKYFHQEKDNIQEAVKLINRNTAKKMNYFLNINIENFDFIDIIRTVNKFPIIIKYKNNVKMIGSKFLIIPKKDELSQQAVKLLYTTGIGNKNATVGGGFFNIGV